MKAEVREYGRLGRWGTVGLFAVAMAWMESAVVFYLRTMVDRIEPYQTDPLPLVGGLGGVELVREAATLLMLLAVGMLAGRTWHGKFAYSAIAFGLWDIFYYVFLRVICDWPRTLLDWDVLFLLPLPWWGPVIAPVLIALLMVFWGSLVVWRDESPVYCAAGLSCWLANTCGIGIALYVFMADALQVASQGEAAIRQVLPKSFNWPLFLVALALMAAPIGRLAWAAWSGRDSMIRNRIAT